jgi:hypothetical protein
LAAEPELWALECEAMSMTLRISEEEARAVRTDLHPDGPHSEGLVRTEGEEDHSREPSVLKFASPLSETLVESIVSV